MQDNDTLIELLQITSKLASQIDSMDQRMSKIEGVLLNDVRQDQRLAAIEQSLERGNQKFMKIEDRVAKIENAEGDKAKNFMKRITTYVLTALLGLFLGSLKDILAVIFN